MTGSPDDRYRGPAPPTGAITLEEATQSLPSLSGKSDMTVRRVLEPVRVGKWRPEGTGHWRVIYDAERVREIGRALAKGGENQDRPRQRDPRRIRPLSRLPHGPRAGWATSDEIQQALRDHGIDGTLFMPRWIRVRLLALGVPSERRVVTRAVQRVFPLDRAIAVLKADPLVKNKLR